jgi:hypothetical protein
MDRRFASFAIESTRSIMTELITSINKRAAPLPANLPSLHITTTVSVLLPVAIVSLFLFCGDAVSANEQRSFTKKNRQFAWFYKPPANGTLVALVRNFDDFILTHKDEKTRDQLRSRGVKSPILLYMLFREIQDPGSCSAQPFHNQVTWKIGDFCKIKQEHPGWFLLDSEGKPIIHNYAGRRYFVMDPANAEWQAFWLQRVREIVEKHEWDGVFLDVVDASLGDLRQTGKLPARYRNDRSYQAAVEAFLSQIYNSYFQPKKLPLIANIGAVKDSKVWFRYLRHLDGAMIEAFATGWNDKYLNARRWEKQLKLAERAQKLDKRVILVSQGDRTDKERQNFSYASYLLVTSGKASFRYSQGSQYDKIWLYPNYNLKLGDPIGRRYLKNGIWNRRFKNGFVSVHPVSRRVRIEMR